MTDLLALLASGTPPTEPHPDLIAEYATGYHAASFMTFTDPYGHDGSVVHPDVIDFGPRKWRGHQFWMACTPYYQGNDKQENPCVYYADHPTEWHEATVNPVYPWPGTQWNSDTELVYDHTTDELVLIYRKVAQYVLARSSDGASWPVEPTVMNVPDQGEHGNSPAFLWDGTQWLCWAIGATTRSVRRWSAPALEGPWSAPVNTTGIGGDDAWHFNMIWHGSRILCLLQVSMYPGSLHLATSDDGGLTWRRSPTPILSTATGTWDNYRLYRGALTLHPNGTHARVWYPGDGTGSDSWKLGYTEIPLSEWP